MPVTRTVQQLHDLTRRTAWVTGGSRGLGFQRAQALGDAEGLKGAVLLFASDAGKHITGQLLAVDGGASAVVG